MRSIFSLLFAAALALPAMLPAFAADSAKATPLWDGKTFQGWEGDTNKTFRIQDGAIVGGTLEKSIPRNEFLCTTRDYTNFVLTLKFKLLGEGANAGIQFRTKRIPNHHEVSGYQADMGDPAWWGGPPGNGGAGAQVNPPVHSRSEGTTAIAQNGEGGLTSNSQFRFTRSIA